MTRILASATVDDLPILSREQRPPRRVQVWGHAEHQTPLDDQRRIYLIEANTDTEAAREGIRRFVEEMSSQFDQPYAPEGASET